VAAEERAYLDHASTSPLRPEARQALLAALDGPAGDPGRIHREGMTVRALLEDARDRTAALVGARPRQVVFTSGATESIAAVGWGGAARGGHQVVTAVEHSAVTATAAQHGDVTVVGVDGLGRVDPERVAAAVRPDTSVVHVQWGNHEVGTTQPVAEVVEACRDLDVLVHVDAAQAVGHVPVDVGALGADLLSLSGHKLGAPLGTGALVVRRGLRLEPLLVGSDQERARRAGLENTPALAGLGAAAAALLDGDRLAAEEAEGRRLTDRVLAAVEGLDGVRVHGDPVGRLPHLVCLGFDDVEPQAVLLGLDRRGVACHSGSACSTESLEPSPTLAAMGVDALRSLRVSTGWSSTDADVDALLAALPPVLAELRALRG
jgi:cysteine desulfurase